MKYKKKAVKKRKAKPSSKLKPKPRLKPKTSQFQMNIVVGCDDRQVNVRAQLAKPRGVLRFKRCERRMSNTANTFFHKRRG